MSEMKKVHEVKTRDLANRAPVPVHDEIVNEKGIGPVRHCGKGGTVSRADLSRIDREAARQSHSKPSEPQPKFKK